MRVEESTIIERSPEDVFAFFVERTNDRRWMGTVKESEWLDPEGPTGPGRRGRMVMNAMGRREFVDEVTEFEPGRLVGHRSVSPSMVIRTACIAEPARGGCRATVVYDPERLPGGVLGRVLEPLTSRVARRNFRADLATLKEILESEAADTR